MSVYDTKFETKEPKNISEMDEIAKKSTLPKTNQMTVKHADVNTYNTKNSGSEIALQPIPTLDEDEEKTKVIFIDIVERKAPVIALLIPFSMIGVLVRIGLTNLNQYPGAPVFPLVYSQFIGCLIMGFCVAFKEIIMNKYLPAYIGLGVGLCGSITTFSSWNLGIFKAIIDYETPQHPRAYSPLAALVHVAITIGMSVSGLKFGEHLADFFLPKNFPKDKSNAKNNSKSKKTSYRVVPRKFKYDDLIFIDWICISLGFFSILTVVILTILIKEHRKIMFATIFAPIGTLTRWKLSRFNTVNMTFPFGTFAANIFGTLVLGILFILSNGEVNSKLGCQVISGLSDGFCGCLTTISTFAVEITSLPRVQAYRYAIFSVVMAQVTMVVTLGIYDWTVGLRSTCDIK
ncbi:hypothetical protein G9A89_013602 [Geosiphon pyriformis]|nr:hypothetical protein G9A89_013602 [Geosiphon pyriformis]